jgi:proteasome accessory factor C
LGLELLRESLSSENPSRASEIDALLKKMKSLVGDVVEVQASLSPLHLSIINKAIATRGIIKIEYLGALDSKAENRVVEPLEVYHHNGKSYLAAHCHQARALRNFRIDRIASVSGDATAEHEHISVPHEETNQSAIEISIVRNRRHLLELFAIDDADGSENIALPIYSREWAARAIVANAGDVELTAPEDLRLIVSGLLSNILALYRS